VNSGRLRLAAVVPALRHRTGASERSHRMPREAERRRRANAGRACGCGTDQTLQLAVSSDTAFLDSRIAAGA